MDVIERMKQIADVLHKQMEAVENGSGEFTTKSITALAEAEANVLNDIYSLIEKEEGYLSNINTKALVKELENRSCVYSEEIPPYEKRTIECAGPMKVLKIID